MQFNTLRIVAALYSFSLVGCAFDSSHRSANSIKDFHVTAYHPPQGIATRPRDVSVYGPGSIIRLNGQGYEAGASFLLGADQVGQWANNPTQYASRSDFPERTEQTSFGIALNGSVVSAKPVYDVKASLDINGATTLEIKRGRTWALNPIGTMQLRAALRAHRKEIDPETLRNIRAKRSGVVLVAYFSEGLSYIYHRQNGGKINLAAELRPQQKASLDGSAFKVVDDKLVTDEPVFIGYALLPDAADILKGSEQ